MIHPAGAISKRLIDRRDFLKAAGAAFAVLARAAAAVRRHASRPTRSSPPPTRATRRRLWRGDPVGSRQAAVHRSPLPDRGHDVTFDPSRAARWSSRGSPGTFAVVFDHAGATPPVTITSVAGRHFFGHGVFSPDGALLYATENDFDNAAGMVGVYDATGGFARIGEFPDPWHRTARTAAARRRPHAGDRQWRHRDASGFRPRQAQHRDHEAVIRVHRPR